LAQRVVIFEGDGQGLYEVQGEALTFQPPRPLVVLYQAEK
jgi:hypothetical protein